MAYIPGTARLATRASLTPYIYGFEYVLKVSRSSFERCSSTPLDDSHKRRFRSWLGVPNTHPIRSVSPATGNPFVYLQGLRVGAPLTGSAGW